MAKKAFRAKESDAKVASDRDESSDLDRLRRTFMETMRTYRTPSEGLKHLVDNSTGFPKATVRAFENRPRGSDSDQPVAREEEFSEPTVLSRGPRSLHASHLGDVEGVGDYVEHSGREKVTPLGTPSQDRKKRWQWYAVGRGRAPGIYCTWAECEAQIHGVANAKFKGFSDLDEAKAFVQEVVEADAFNASLGRTAGKSGPKEASPISEGSSRFDLPGESRYTHQEEMRAGSHHIGERQSTARGQWQTPVRHREGVAGGTSSPANRLKMFRHYSGASHSTVELQVMRPDLMRLAEEGGLAYLIRSLTDVEAM